MNSLLISRVDRYWKRKKTAKNEDEQRHAQSEIREKQGSKNIQTMGQI